MDMLKEHEDAVESEEAVYHEFLIWFKKDRKEVYAIVEGEEDPIFYRGVIDSLLPPGWTARTIAAGKKRMVLDTLSSMDWTRFPPKRVCFFVDRDLSDFLGEVHGSEHGNLYSTDKYSIENELANEATLIRSLREVMGVTRISPEEELKISAAYNESFSNFAEAFSVIMAQVISWMRATRRPCLKNIDPSVMFSFSDGVLELKQDFLSPRARVEYAANQVREWPDDDAVLTPIVEEFNQRNGRLGFVRGKYVFWFFTKSVLAFHSSIDKYCAEYSAPPRTRVALGPKNAMAVLAGKARCWRSLREFLEANFISYAVAHG